MDKAQGGRCEKQWRWSWITAARQDVQDDVGRVDALSEGLGAGGIDRRKPFGQNRGEDVDHLAVSVISPCSLRRTFSSALGRTQSLNGAPLRRAPGLRTRTGT